LGVPGHFGHVVASASGDASWWAQDRAVAGLVTHRRDGEAFARGSERLSAEKYRSYETLLIRPMGR
jgi:hypothetical protein